jgi:ATP-binding cassette subfamily F protein 2
MPPPPAPARLVLCAGTYANLVKQAKSKQKILDKMYEAGLTQPVQREQTFQFQFPGAPPAPGPIRSSR